MEEHIAVTIDFTFCKYASELYKEMRTKMEWDEDFGENLSALWDILWGMSYKGDDFTIIRPLQFTEIPYGKTPRLPNMWIKSVRFFKGHRIRAFSLSGSNMRTVIWIPSLII